MNSTTGINSTAVSASARHHRAAAAAAPLDRRVFVWRAAPRAADKLVLLRAESRDWALPFSSEATLPRWDHAQKRKGDSDDFLVDFAATVSLRGTGGEQR